MGATGKPEPEQPASESTAEISQTEVPVAEAPAPDTNLPHWPFSRPALLGGLRRHLDAPSLRLGQIEPRPLPRIVPDSSFTDSGTTLSAMTVHVTLDGDEHTLSLLLKEPPVTADGRILKAVGQREYGVYHRLAAHLPMLVPGLIAGDPYDGWIVLEGMAAMRPVDEWRPEDYEEAIINLAQLHDRFWGGGQDLAVFPWLARPFDADYEQTIAAAGDAASSLLDRRHLPQLTDERLTTLIRKTVASADQIAAPLLQETMTLIHGDYWPGNIARQIDGRQMVFDWQLASVSPAVIDLVGFIQATRMKLTPSIPLENLIKLYRRRLDLYVQPGWDDEHFDLLWDHALMWRFLTNWLARLATIQPQAYAAFHRLFSTVWLEPLFEIVERRL